MAAFGDLARTDEYGDDLADPFAAAAYRQQRKYLGRNLAGTGVRDQGDVLPDFVRTGIAHKLGDIAAMGSGAAAAEFGPQYGFTSEDAHKEFESHPALKRLDPEPPGFWSRTGSEAVRMGLDPTSWVGPGGVPYKAAGNALSALGSEAAGTAAAGTKAEPYARFAGGFGPAAAERVLPALYRSMPSNSLGVLGGPMIIPTPREAPRASPFFSAVESTIAGSPLKQAPAAQWAGTIRNAPGVKPAELEQLGVEGWLGQQQGAVPKQALADYVAANKVNVGEKVRGAPISDARTRDLERQYTDALLGGLTEVPGAEGRLARLQNEINANRVSREQSAPKFSTYQLPGGENYRETLLTLPARKQYGVRVDDKGEYRLFDTENKDWLRTPDGRVRPGFSSEDAAQQAAQGWNNSSGSSPGLNFRGTHWDEPNVLAHYRTNDRIIGGKKTLFGEELQSDWHQKGRVGGYSPEEHLRKKQAIADELSALGFSRDPDITARRNFLQDKMTKVIRAGHVPDAPFQSNWHELAMKRLIRDAAEGGYEQLAWTPGAVQNKRYPDPGRPDVAMEAFYDKMLPAAANKIGKPYGAQVRQERLLTEGPSYGQNLDQATEEALQAIIDRMGGTRGPQEYAVHTLPITSQLREQALYKGFPMYAVPGAIGLGALADPLNYRD